VELWNCGIAESGIAGLALRFLSCHSILPTASIPHSRICIITQFHNYIITCRHAPSRASCLWRTWSQGKWKQAKRTLSVLLFRPFGTTPHLPDNRFQHWLGIFVCRTEAAVIVIPFLQNTVLPVQFIPQLFHAWFQHRHVFC